MNSKKQKNRIEIFSYRQTDSTNMRARCYAEKRNAKLPALFVAWSQSEGRGRLGRSFYSPENSGLYMTLLVRSPDSERHFTLLTALCAVVVSDVLYDKLGVSVGIKWVNDLYFKGKKVAGILAESFEVEQERYIALGIGINICTREFPEELKDIAGTVLKEGEFSEKEGKELALMIASRLLGALEEKELSGYMARYRERSCIINKSIEFFENGVGHRARALGINDDGALEVELENGNQRLLIGGEISVREVPKQ